MSTIWTPGGERPVGRPDPPPQQQQQQRPAPESAEAETPLTEEEMAERLGELRDQLAATPVEGIVAQVAYQLFEVGALHLSLDPPRLPQARLAIDAMAALVEGMAGRLGEHEDQLRDGLTQIRLAFVQVQKAHEQPS